jgi:hypothetical protein
MVCKRVPDMTAKNHRRGGFEVWAEYILTTYKDGPDMLRKLLDRPDLSDHQVKVIRELLKDAPKGHAQ